MFGNGDMGQLGLGPDTLDEIPRPRIHTWYIPSNNDLKEEKLITRFEEMAEDGELSRDGKAGGGLETIYAGGMHNLAIDEAGKVRPIYEYWLGRGS
jgi:regulator of chromosome condensation